MIDTVVFDLDDTICEYRQSGREILAGAFDEVGVEPFFTVGDYLGIFEDHAARGEPVDTIRERCFETLAAEQGFEPDLGRELANIYRTSRDHRDVRFRPGAAEALDRLRTDHRLGLVTNGGPQMQRQKLDALELTDTFDTLVFAGYETEPKPSAEPFHRALDALSAEPAGAVHVGNSLSADVAGAHAAGLTSVWIPNGHGDMVEGPDPHFSLESLHELHDPPWL